ncbi:TRI39 ligase, partial [Amia calva]|nr:TRI39 ligase [Amia calva]
IGHDSYLNYFCVVVGFVITRGNGGFCTQEQAAATGAQLQRVVEATQRFLSSEEQRVLECLRREEEAQQEEIKKEIRSVKEGLAILTESLKEVEQEQETGRVPPKVMTVAAVYWGPGASHWGPTPGRWRLGTEQRIPCFSKVYNQNCFKANEQTIKDLPESRLSSKTDLPFLCQDQAHTRRTRLLALFNSLYLHLGLTEQALRLGVRHQRSLLRADLEGKARLAEAAKWSLMKEVQRVEELAAVKDLFLMNVSDAYIPDFISIPEPLTFDPNTAHPNLLVSEDGRTVEHTAVRQEVPDNPERYNTCLCVLAAQGFISGRHYWEVEVGEKIHWDLGVARESVIRKGNISLGPSSGYWAIMLRDGSKYSTCTSQTLPIEVVRWPSKIGILLDYEKGSLSFYNTADGSWLFSFSDTFNERLYPYFHFGPNDDGRNSLALRICPPQATMEE